MKSIFAEMERQIYAASNPGNINDFWYGGAEIESDSGVRITSESAMRQSMIWKCIRWKGENFAKLPKKIFERVEKFGLPGRREAPEHRLFPIVHKAPNPVVPAFAFFELLSRDLDVEGNFYAFIQRDDFGNPRYLWRLLPDEQHMRTKYVAMNDSGAPNGTRQQLLYIANDGVMDHTFYPDEILHVRGLGFDGLKGYSPIRQMMNTLGWNRATERYGAQFFKNASRPGMIVVAPGTIKEPQRSELIERLSSRGRKAGGLTLIEGGLTPHKWALDQDEAQFIETMEFQQEDICGIFGVKPHKVGIMRHMTNNNIEQINIDAATDCMHPLSERVEQWFELALMLESERDRFYMETELKGMMKGDMKTRSEFYRIMVFLGVMSPNMVAIEENIEPYEGGDIRVMQGAMMTVDRIASGQTSQLPAAPSTDAPNPDGTPNPTGADVDTIRKAYAHVFADAVGRITHKAKKADRERTAAQTFYSVFKGLADLLHADASTEFITEYLATLTQRVATWTAETITETTAYELDRAVTALLTLVPEGKDIES